MTNVKDSFTVRQVKELYYEEKLGMGIKMTRSQIQKRKNDRARTENFYCKGQLGQLLEDDRMLSEYGINSTTGFTVGEKVETIG